jgi:tetraprenyl-beta-curcumene synthase
LLGAALFARAARRYWTSVFPYLDGELRGWSARAAEIRDPLLRELALTTLREKRRSLEGAAAFAAFVPRGRRRAAITALGSYQLIFDYLDTVGEQPNRDPIANGRQLNSALLSALEPSGSHPDYYALNESRSDDGYLEHLIDTCRAALARLPSYAALAPFVRLAAERVATYQTLNHGDAEHSHEAFTAWSREQTGARSELRWWETGAAAGSSLAVLALISGMCDPCFGAGEAAAVHDAYYPWVGALHTLLDSLIDREEDRAAVGQRSLFDYYGSPTEAAARLELIAGEAARRVRRLPHARSHVMLLAAMASFYLADPQAATPHTRVVRDRVLASMGSLAGPTMLVMRARQLADPLLGARRRLGSPQRAECRGAR